MKLLTVALLLVAVILVGCGGEKSKSEEDSFVVKASYQKKEDEERQRKNMSEGLILGETFWVDKDENIRDFLEALETRDDEFFVQQIHDGKIYYVEKDTRINISNDTLNNGKIVKIQFLRGKYKNKEGYTYIKFVVKTK